MAMLYEGGAIKREWQVTCLNPEQGGFSGEEAGKEAADRIPQES